MGRNAIKDVSVYQWISRVKKIQKFYEKNSVLITGSSGFIGFHVCKYFLERKIKVIGIDNHNNYYDRNLKFKRCKKLSNYKNFKFVKLDIKNQKIF